MLCTIFQITRERFYPEVNVTIDAVGIMLLSAYNQTKNEGMFDERFCYFLLSSILTDDEKQKKTVDKAKVNFARKIFAFRLRGAADASERIDKFNFHAKLLIREIREKSRKLKS